MTRKTSTVVIETEGRDQGKVFHIQELPSEQGEAWAYRLMLALSRAGVEVPENFFAMGMAGVAVMGLKAMGGLPWDVAKPLLDEMMSCVKIQPNPSRNDIIRPLIDRGSDGDDIEEISTRVRLREEVITLHTGFSIREFISNYQTTLAERAERAAEELTATGPPTEMFDPRSVESSRAA